jgi:hypothetical protein
MQQFISTMPKQNLPPLFVGLSVSAFSFSRGKPNVAG